MTALIISILFILFIALLLNKKGLEFYELHSGWLDVLSKLFVVTSLGLVLFGGYGSFEYSFLFEQLQFESNPLRMFIFTVWMMLASKGLSRQNSRFMLPSVFSGLLTFSSSFETGMIVLGGLVTFLPNETDSEKVAKRLMFLLLGMALIVEKLAWVNLPYSGFYSFSILIIVICLKFNFSFSRPETSIYPTIIWGLVSNLSLLEVRSSDFLFAPAMVGFTLLGVLFLSYDYFKESKLKVFTALPSLFIILLASTITLKVYTQFLILFPLVWYFLLQKNEDLIEMCKVEKILIAMMLFSIGLTPFTPGGWSLNMFWSELIALNVSVPYMLPVVCIFLITSYFGLMGAFKTIKTAPAEKQTSGYVYINLVLTVVVFGFLYFATVPDIFSEASSFEFLRLMGLELSTTSDVAWRTKNLLFLFSILLPVIVFGAVYFLEKNRESFDINKESIKIKVQGTVLARMPFLNKGLGLKTHMGSVFLRNKSELFLRGILLVPTQFSFEVVSSFGALLGKMRPKGINSNLLYTIIVTALVLIFYIGYLL